MCVYFISVSIPKNNVFPYVIYRHPSLSPLQTEPSFHPFPIHLTGFCLHSWSITLFQSHSSIFQTNSTPPPLFQSLSPSPPLPPHFSIHSRLYQQPFQSVFKRSNPPTTPHSSTAFRLPNSRTPSFQPRSLTSFSFITIPIFLLIKLGVRERIILP